MPKELKDRILNEIEKYSNTYDLTLENIEKEYIKKGFKKEEVDEAVSSLVDLELVKYEGNLLKSKGNSKKSTLINGLLMAIGLILIVLGVFFFIVSKTGLGLIALVVGLVLGIIFIVSGFKYKK